MFMFVLSFYLYFMAVKDGCLLWNRKNLTTELCMWIITHFKSIDCVLTNDWSKSIAAT